MEQKYNKLRRPVFDRRGQALSAIPHFWLQVFVNHPQLGGLLTERDETLLTHLRALDVTEFDDIKSGFRITFVRPSLTHSSAPDLQHLPPFASVDCTNPLQGALISLRLHCTSQSDS